jgi:hypothetical protein
MIFCQVKLLQLKSTRNWSRKKDCLKKIVMKFRSYQLPTQNCVINVGFTFLQWWKKYKILCSVQSRLGYICYLLLLVILSHYVFKSLLLHGKDLCLMSYVIYDFVICSRRCTFFKFNVFCWSIECLQLEQNVYLKYVYVVILLSISGGVARWSFFCFIFFMCLKFVITSVVLQYEFY